MNTTDKLVIGGHEFTSRFILGSGKYSLGLIEAAVRDAGAAGSLLEDARRSIPLPSSQAMRTHGKRGKDDVRRLFR